MFVITSDEMELNCGLHLRHQLRSKNVEIHAEYNRINISMLKNAMMQRFCTDRNIIVSAETSYCPHAN